MQNHEKDNYEKLIGAFDDAAFQEQINQYRYNIELELKKFLKWLPSVLAANQKIFHSPESRIKSRISFEEKIHRKDYINNWVINECKEEVQNQILTNLPDLIGFRITCYFMDDEEVIYEKLKRYYDLHNFSNISLNFSENTLQKNGKKLYKVTGKYDNKVNFELQIKAATHNVWGEVEHKTVYKGSQYSINHQERQTITDEIFNILKSSDRQMLALFKNSYTQEELVCALFSEQTRTNVKTVAKTEYLAGHYTSFFSIFLVESKEFIYQYVSAALSNGNLTYVRKSPLCNSSIEINTEIIQRVKNTFIEYYLQVQYCIAQELYQFQNYDDFLVFMLKNAGRNIALDNDEESVEGDVFAEEDSLFKEDYGELILKVLKDKLPDALRERG